MEIHNNKYFEEVKTFARSIGLIKQLEDKLNYLENYSDETAKCFLYKDFAPYSFQFTMTRQDKDGEDKYWFNGGLIFHGAHDNGGDGSFPTLTVSISPSTGWQIHT